MAAGAPKGNKNNVKNRPWAEAIDKALKQSENGKPTKLRQLADKLIEACMNGEQWAFRELGDRVDGKALASLEVSGSVDVTEHPTVQESRDRVAELTGSRVKRSPTEHTTH